MYQLIIVLILNGHNVGQPVVGATVTWNECKVLMGAESGPMMGEVILTTCKKVTK